MAKIILDYSKQSDSDFANTTLEMVNALTGNSNFGLPWPTEYPTLAAFTAKQKEFADKVTAAGDRDKAKVAAKNACRDELQAMVRDSNEAARLQAEQARRANEDKTRFLAAASPVPATPAPIASSSAGWHRNPSRIEKATNSWRRPDQVPSSSIVPGWSSRARAGTAAFLPAAKG